MVDSLLDNFNSVMRALRLASHAKKPSFWICNNYSSIVELEDPKRANFNAGFTSIAFFYVNFDLDHGFFLCLIVLVTHFFIKA